ncbi:hypothetical protein PPYR_07494 [Photinus pyralis]|uniref:Organic solute transporter alpha-like protein n=1 Tax=Photinus pyralis TaxID=7054 RepID=A0A5N4AQJ6_PHOPY|nr:hypothetical protein PPYR_07494 [Photinus pyralis]
MTMNEDNADDVFSEQVKRYGISKLAKLTNYNNNSCPEVVPSTKEYISAINVYGIPLIAVGVLAVILILYMFIDTLLYIIKNSPPRVKTYSASVIGVYPVVAIATLCATIVPRSQLLAEAVTQGIFMIGMYQLFCLFVAYCGGEAELIRNVKPSGLNTKVAPCCCWPCCCCLPSFDINKNRVRNLRLLVLQLPVVQGLVYMTLLVLWAERERLYQVNYIYMQPVIVTSIFFGVWGMTMTIQLLKELLKDYWMFSKFIVLQLVLILSKLQGITMKGVVKLRLLPCHPPLTPTVYSNLIYNCLIMLEMVLLGFIARRLYKRALPNMSLSENKISPVCLVGQHMAANGSIIAVESNNNDISYVDHNEKMKDESEGYKVTTK